MSKDTFSIYQLKEGMKRGNTVMNRIARLTRAGLSVDRKITTLSTRPRLRRAIPQSRTLFEKFIIDHPLIL
jgi:hypothetical protein